MSDIEVHEATEAEAREAVIVALKFSRRWAIRCALLIAGNVLVAGWDAWFGARDLALHYYLFAAIMAAGAFVAVWSAGRTWPLFIRSFRMWQLHCLMLETFPAQPPPTPPHQ